MVDIGFNITGDKGIFGFVENAPAIAVHLLREAIDDIADQVESEARRNVPEGPSGELKAHPVDRDDTFIGEPNIVFPSFGGGFSVQGPGGRFIAGNIPIGRTVAHSVITVAEVPRHARWVHNGTGIFGPKARPIRPRTKAVMVFEGYGEFEGKTIVAKRIRGQRQQPYLEDAYQLIINTYVPERFLKLKEQIELAT